MTGNSSLVLTLGLGNGTLVGSTSHALTLGYGIGAQGATLVGRWANVINAQSSNKRLVAQSSNTRLEPCRI